jgi:DNA-binding transcriptional ArsR family regulator
MPSEKLDPQQALLKALGHPMRKALLSLCLEAGERRSPKELALETYRGKRSFQAHLSSVSYHMRTLEKYGALEITAEEARRGSVAHFYEPSELVRKTPWVIDALPPLTKGERARIDKHVAERRKGQGVHGPAEQRAEENHPVLDRLRESEEDESTKKTNPRRSRRTKASSSLPATSPKADAKAQEPDQGP